MFSNTLYMSIGLHFGFISTDQLTHDFSVHVLQTDIMDAFVSLCGVYKGAMQDGAVETITCREDVWGQIVRLSANDIQGEFDLMHFCEIQVYGDSVTLKRKFVQVTHYCGYLYEMLLHETSHGHNIGRQSLKQI